MVFRTKDWVSVDCGTSERKSMVCAPVRPKEITSQTDYYLVNLSSKTYILTSYFFLCDL